MNTLGAQHLFVALTVMAPAAAFTFIVLSMVS